MQEGKTHITRLRKYWNIIYLTEPGMLRGPTIRQTIGIITHFTVLRNSLIDAVACMVRTWVDLACYPQKVIELILKMAVKNVLQSDVWNKKGIIIIDGGLGTEVDDRGFSINVRTCNVTPARF